MASGDRLSDTHTRRPAQLAAGMSVEPAPEAASAPPAPSNRRDRGVEVSRGHGRSLRDVPQPPLPVTTFDLDAARVEIRGLWRRIQDLEAQRQADQAEIGRLRDEVFLLHRAVNRLLQQVQVHG